MPTTASTTLEFDATLTKNGYRWWYVDGLSDDGECGITLIAFLGSVFSPYYAAARRRGPANPLDHCALNVALYGRRERWSMTERGARTVLRDRDHLQIGPSTLSWNGSELIVQLNELAFPRLGRLRGEVRVSPEVVYLQHYMLDAAGRHHWWPVAPRASVNVSLDAPAMSWSGSGYIDSNYGSEPLEAGFTRWEWSRSTSPHGSTVLYDAQRRDGSELSLALEFSVDAVPRELTVERQVRLPATRWGVERSTRVAGNVAARVARTLEDGPFYGRSLLELTGAGESAQAFHESLSLQRFSSRWVQLLLPFRMPRRG